MVTSCRKQEFIASNPSFSPSFLSSSFSFIFPGLGGNWRKLAEIKGSYYEADEWVFSLKFIFFSIFLLVIEY